MAIIILVFSVLGELFKSISIKETNSFKLIGKETSVSIKVKKGKKRKSR